jgi:hypothetical protein
MKKNLKNKRNKGNMKYKISKRLLQMKMLKKNKDSKSLMILESPDMIDLRKTMMIK